MKVLIVDDLEANLYLLRTLFTISGHTVVEAENGKLALEAARSSPPDLIVSDILMPVMDGFALCRIWKEDPVLRSIPFIFYTATYTEPKDKAFALNLGADRFLVKPMESHLLLREVDDVMKSDTVSESRPAQTQEPEFYREYNIRLINKLEDKLAQLEVTSHNLFLANEELRHSNAKNHALLESTAEAIYGVDTDGICTFVNPACVEMLGYRDASRIVGQNMHKLVHHSSANGALVPLNSSLISQALGGSKIVHEECAILWRADGASFEAELRARRTFEKGECTGIVVTFLDITKRLQAAESERRLRSQLVRAERLSTVSKLATGLAHEINQPLCAIGNYVSASTRQLESGKFDLAEIGESFELIGEQVTRATGVVDWLRGAVKSDETASSDLNINSSIARATKYLRNEIEANGSRVRLDLTADMPLVHANEVQIQQVILNLILNSLDAAGEAAGEDHQVWITSSLTAEGSVHVEVKDNGPGIDEDFQDDLFREFASSKENGLGLGLSISRGIIEAHGGQLWLDSKPGKGAAFIFSLRPAADRERGLEAILGQGGARLSN
jgi:PAS domain S-box-containing protein